MSRFKFFDQQEVLRRRNKKKNIFLRLNRVVERKGFEPIVKGLSPIVFLFGAVLLLSGCGQNTFTQFYKGETFQDVAAFYDNIPSPLEEPIVQLSSNLSPATPLKMFEDGWGWIGESSWEGPMVSSEVGENLARQHAKKIGASYVLWRYDYRSTHDSVISMPIVQPGQTYTTQHYGTVGGIGGVPYSGTSFTTTSPQVSYKDIPITIHRYAYRALFFIKITPRPFKLDIQTEEPPIEFKQKFDTNAGMKVLAALKGGNAYKANILPGDIILKINENNVYHDKPTNLKKGRNIIKLYRSDKEMIKEIIL